MSTTAATLANVASSATNVTLFAASTSAYAETDAALGHVASRRVVFNDSTAMLYLKFGAVASVTSYTVQIAAGGYYEFPAPVYAGQVDGIWASANGNARLTSW